MGDLPDFQRGRIVGASLTGASVITAATYWVYPEQQFLRLWQHTQLMGRHHQLRRMVARNQNLSERDCSTLKRIVSNNQRTIAAKVTAELNIHLEYAVSTKTVCWELHKFNIDGSAWIAKRLVTDNNAKGRKRWCNNHKTWLSDDWKYIIWSDESPFTLFPTSGRVYVWRMPKEAYNAECLVPTVKHGGGSVMIWAAILCCFAGPIITLNGRITASD